MRLELLRSQDRAGVLDERLLAIVMLAWWYKRALVASVVVDEVALKVHSSLLQSIETLLLEQIPHLLLSDVVALLD